MRQRWIQFGGLLAVSLLFAPGCAQPCRNDTDCGSGAICQGSFCETADLSQRAGQWCDTSAECAPDERCASSRCEPRSYVQKIDGGGGSDGGTDGGTDGGEVVIPPDALCQNLSLDDVYLLGEVPGLGTGLTNLKTDSTRYCVQAFSNSAIIRGSDGRLVYRDRAIQGGKAHAMVPDQTVRQSNGSLKYDIFSNDLDVSTPPCDTSFGSLSDFRMNPSDWTTVHKCTTGTLIWHDSTGTEVQEHQKYGYQNSTFDFAGSSVFIGTPGGDFVVDSTMVENAQFFLGLSRAISTGFIVATDDGFVPHAAWNIAFDGKLTKIGNYGPYPAGFRTDSIKSERALRTDGALYLLGTDSQTHVVILEFLPDGSDPSKIYDLQENQGVYGKLGAFVHTTSPKILVTGP